MKKYKKINIISENLIEPKRIVDGMNETWDSPISLKINGDEILLSDLDFFNNNLKSLFSVMEKVELRSILLSLRISVNGVLENIYHNRNGLQSYFNIQANNESLLLIILSMGEFQPARYISEVDGVWEIEVID